MNEQQQELEKAAGMQNPSNSSSPLPNQLTAQLQLLLQQQQQLQQLIQAQQILQPQQQQSQKENQKESPQQVADAGINTVSRESAMNENMPKQVFGKEEGTLSGCPVNKNVSHRNVDFSKQVRKEGVPDLNAVLLGGQESAAGEGRLEGFKGRHDPWLSMTFGNITETAKEPWRLRGTDGDNLETSGKNSGSVGLRESFANTAAKEEVDRILQKVLEGSNPSKANSMEDTRDFHGFEDHGKAASQTSGSHFEGKSHSDRVDFLTMRIPEQLSHLKPSDFGLDQLVASVRQVEQRNSLLEKRNAELQEGMARLEAELRQKESQVETQAAHMAALVSEIERQVALKHRCMQETANAKDELAKSRAGIGRRHSGESSAFAGKAGEWEAMEKDLAASRDLQALMLSALSSPVGSDKWRHQMNILQSKLLQQQEDTAQEKTKKEAVEDKKRGVGAGEGRFREQVVQLTAPRHLASPNSSVPEGATRERPPDGTATALTLGPPPGGADVAGGNKAHEGMGLSLGLRYNGVSSSAQKETSSAASVPWGPHGPMWHVPDEGGHNPLANHVALNTYQPVGGGKSGKAGAVSVRGKRKCPVCKALIAAAAADCSHCGHMFRPSKWNKHRSSISMAASQSALDDSNAQPPMGTFQNVLPSPQTSQEPENAASQIARNLPGFFLASLLSGRIEPSSGPPLSFAQSGSLEEHRNPSLSGGPLLEFMQQRQNEIMKKMEANSSDSMAQTPETTPKPSVEIASGRALSERKESNDGKEEKLSNEEEAPVKNVVSLSSNAKESPVAPADSSAEDHEDKGEEAERGVAAEPKEIAVQCKSDEKSVKEEKSSYDEELRAAKRARSL